MFESPFVDLPFGSIRVIRVVRGPLAVVRAKLCVFAPLLFNSSRPLSSVLCLRWLPHLTYLTFLTHLTLALGFTLAL